jgi:cytochrome c peroxidase
MGWSPTSIGLEEGAMSRRVPRRAFLPLAALWAGVVMPALVFSQGTGQGGQVQGTSTIVISGTGEIRHIVFTSVAARLPRLLIEMVMPVPTDNPMSEERVVLGRRLFFDTALSLDHSVSCATCHDPEHAFSDARPLAIGIGGKTGRRNSPTLVNRGFGRLHFWDGRAATLEAQVVMPIADPNEMAMPLDDLVTRLGADESYRMEFQVVFNRPIASEDLGRALASYVRTIRSANAPFDRFSNGATDALSADAQAGLALFRGKARCGVCHREPTFTDEQFYNTGVALGPDNTFLDDGRFAVSGQERERGAFKVPTLREVARTAPYMHDGSLATLQDVVKFYDRGGRPNRNLTGLIKPLGLTADEKRGLVAFLESLSGVVTGKPGETPAMPEAPSRAVPGGGIMIPGWAGKIDPNEERAGLVLNNAKLALLGPDLQVTTGPTVTYWNPANTAAGDYTVQATFTEAKYMDQNTHAHPYGLVIAGNDLGTATESLLYCSAYGDGKFIVRGFGPAPFQLGGATHAAVNKAAGKGSPVTQEVAMSVRGDKIECAINGTIVASYDKASVVAPGKLTSTDGVFGIRVGHNTDVVVKGLGVIKK